MLMLMLIEFQWKMSPDCALLKEASHHAASASEEKAPQQKLIVRLRWIFPRFQEVFGVFQGVLGRVSGGDLKMDSRLNAQNFPPERYAPNLPIHT